MGVGFGLLRLSPAQFWTMSPRELSAAIEGLLPASAGRTDRAGLEALMRRFPDEGQRRQE